MPLIIDADTHVIEPADLWTSRVQRKWVADVPRVQLHPRTNHNHWRIGDAWLHAVGYYAQAGWKEYPPYNPSEYDEVDPASYNATARLERMDEYGIHSQVLYPNIIGFQSPLFMSMDPELSLLCVRAYNDFLSEEWVSVDPMRFVPIAMVPFWDVSASVAEMERCAELGFRGILFANKYEKVGLPSFIDHHWDPIYAAAQEMDLAVNYHVGFASPEVSLSVSEQTLTARLEDVDDWRRAMAQIAAIGHMSQAEIVAEIVTSGICDRFPRLRLVSVESGFGYVPYLLEALDWAWKIHGTYLKHSMLPSEYFQRQCYGTFWSERSTLRLLDLYPDNFMYSTDFPHVASVSPGPTSPADVPAVHIGKAFAHCDAGTAKKALHDNAVKVYRLAE